MKGIGKAHSPVRVYHYVDGLFGVGSIKNLLFSQTSDGGAVPARSGLPPGDADERTGSRADGPRRPNSRPPSEPTVASSLRPVLSLLVPRTGAAH